MNKEKNISIAIIFCFAHILATARYAYGMETGISRILLGILLVLPIIWLFVMYYLLNEQDKNSEEIRKLKIDRHDFLNHLQVLYGLIKIKKYIRACEYIKGTTKNIYGINGKLQNVVDEQSPIINAVLLPRLNRACTLKVRVLIELDPFLTDSNINEQIFSRIIGNIIDNALDALEEVESPELVIKTSKKDEFINISIGNNGLPIPREVLPHIFEEGFTKKGNGEGLGLYIVKSLIEDIGGNIRVTSTKEEGTIFEVQFPIKK